MTHTRTRYQQGSLTTEKRANGPDVWVYRWRENAGDGTRVKRKRNVGTVDVLRTKSMAERAIQGLKIDLNAFCSSPARKTVGDVASHFRLVELSSDQRTLRTKQTYEGYLHNFILPKWQELQITDVKAVLVERWLNELNCAPATKSTIRSVMSVLFRHAMRYEWIGTNPMTLVRQSARRQREPEILSIAESQALLTQLRSISGPFYTLTFLALATGLRRGELFGLKWEDIDRASQHISIRRSIVNGTIGLPKTITSCKPVPLTHEVALELERWRAVTQYSSAEDWVFASPEAFGKQPYWPDSVLYKRIRPAALLAGITKQFGWHSFRRTTASLLLLTHTDIRTAQELMRHASPTMTLGLYAQSYSSSRSDAQNAIVELIKGALPAPSGPIDHDGTGSVSA